MLTTLRAKWLTVCQVAVSIGLLCLFAAAFYEIGFST